MRAFLSVSLSVWIASVFYLSPGFAGGDPEANLSGIEWKIVEINGEPTLEDVPASVQFDGAGVLAGSGSCNRFTGRYTVTGDALKIDPRIAATRMMCPPGPMEQERRFFTVLPNLSGFSILADGALLLKGSDGSQILARR